MGHGFVGSTRVLSWVGFTLELSGLGWVGNVPDPGCPANLTKVLPYHCELSKNVEVPSLGE